MRHLRRLSSASRRHAVLGASGRGGRVDRMDLYDPREVTDGLRRLRQLSLPLGGLTLAVANKVH